MKGSIRLRLIHWLEGVINHLPKKFVKLLRRADVHADAACHLNAWFGSGVPNYASEREIEDRQRMTALHERVNEMNRRAIVSDRQAAIPVGQLLPTAQNYLVNHNQSLPSKTYQIGNLTGQANQVESAGYRPMKGEA